MENSGDGERAKEERFRAILDLLSASSDEERLAGLLLVTRVIEPSDHDALRTVWEALPPTFVKRLLRTPDEPSGGSFRSVALAVLATFVDDDVVATDESFLSHLPVVISVLAEPGLEDGASHDAVVLLGSVAERDPIRVIILGGLPALLSVIPRVASDDLRQRAISIVIPLLSHWDDDVARKSEAASALQLVSCLFPLASFFQHNQDSPKFHVAEVLAVLLSSRQDAWRHVLTDAPWVSSVRVGLYDILRSKISDQQRDPALSLASAMIAIFGVAWCWGPGTADTSEDDKFAELLLHLVSVEMYLFLQEAAHQVSEPSIGSISSPPQSPNRLHRMIAVSFSIMEAFLGYLANTEVHPLIASLPALHSAIANGMGVVVEFLTQAKDRMDAHAPIVLACVRLLCAWVVEDTDAALTTKELLPFVLTVCSGADAEGIDATSFLLPALLVLSTDSLQRGSLVRAGCTRHVAAYVHRRIDQILHNASTGTFSSVVEPQVEHSLDFLLNICSLGELKADLPAVQSIVTILFSYARLLSTMPSTDLQALQSLCLCLFVLRESGIRDQDFSNNSLLLWNILRRISDSFSRLNEKNDVEEMWILCVDIASSLLPRDAPLQCTLAESGWALELAQRLRTHGEHESSMWSDEAMAAAGRLLRTASSSVPGGGR